MFADWLRVVYFLPGAAGNCGIAGATGAVGNGMVGMDGIGIDGDLGATGTGPGAGNRIDEVCGGAPPAGTLIVITFLITMVLDWAGPVGTGFGGATPLLWLV